MKKTYVKVYPSTQVVENIPIKFWVKEKVKLKDKAVFSSKADNSAMFLENNQLVIYARDVDDAKRLIKNYLGATA